ncbi:sigma-70 family RNA polymerase sigma factor [Novosphingobium sp. MW5]|nr:sigma-70 family RNA polymerase sigma factor [Novosphingobium sp. MW5]
MTEPSPEGPDTGTGKPFREALVALLPHLRAFARGLCGQAERADDLVQEAVMRAWASRDSFRPGSNFKAWVFTITRNNFLNELRRYRRETQLEDGVAETMLVTRADQEDALNLNDLQRALDKLPPERREALLLIGASGFSYEEAAQVCGVAVGTMKSRVARGRAQLGLLLEEAAPTA